MDYEEEVMKELKNELEKDGASKHDISVILAFNETALDNLAILLTQLEHPVLASHLLKILSRTYNEIEGDLYLFEITGGKNNDRTYRA